MERSIPWLLFGLLLLYGQYVDYQQRLRNDIQAEKLAGRYRWMHALTEAIETSSLDRYRLQDAQQSWNQLIDANPNLVIPEGFHPLFIQNQKLELPEVPK